MTKHLNSVKSELDRSYATTQQYIEELRRYVKMYFLSSPSPAIQSLTHSLTHV
jgi:hypothetical protein